MIAQAERAGGTIAREPGETFWGGYSGVFVDPDGHPWEVAHNPHWTLGADGRELPGVARTRRARLARRCRHAHPNARHNDDEPPGGGPSEKTGGVLLSQALAGQVPSALRGLTALFGMGRGVSPSLKPPEKARDQPLPVLQNCTAPHRVSQKKSVKPSTH